MRSSQLSQPVLISLIISLVGLSSFALGWLAGSDSIQAEPALERTAPFMGQGSTALYVASRHSDKYHYVWCSGANRITEGNKISFDSEDEARRSGYTPAKNCPGLSQ
ncbi:MAG: hypothetical protein WDZ79_02210 [Candidatus Paceibacterota bacterium]